MVIDSDGVAVILATERAEIRGTFGQPDACVAAFDAKTPASDGDHDFGALIFTDDLGHSLLFRADTSSGPQPSPCDRSSASTNKVRSPKSSRASKGSCPTRTTRPSPASATSYSEAASLASSVSASFVAPSLIASLPASTTAPASHGLAYCTGAGA